MKKQIIALGGGGFSMEPDNLALDRYILSQSSKKKPSICFLPTASGDADNYIVRFYNSFNKLNCTPYHLTLFRHNISDIDTFLLKQDIIYVGGGNTRNMIVVWREWGLTETLKKAWNKGVILTGISAGGICWFEEGLTDSKANQLKPMKGLGFLKGSFVPHYDGEANRRPSYHHFISRKEISSGYGVDDGVALHFINKKLHQVVSSRDSGKAYRVALHENVKEDVIKPKKLPAYEISL